MLALQLQNDLILLEILQLYLYVYVCLCVSRLLALVLAVDRRYRPGQPYWQMRRWLKLVGWLPVRRTRGTDCRPKSVTAWRRRQRCACWMGCLPWSMECSIDVRPDPDRRRKRCSMGSVV